MYNGVGLLTPRGTGTSGYVQTNQFNLRRQPPPAGSQQKPGDTKKPRTERKANDEILEHNRKREMEVKLLELRETLEERGYGQEDIEKEVECMRDEMMKQCQEKTPEPAEADLAAETHAIAARKKLQMEKLKDALGLGEVREGEAFNQELQEQRKLERQRIREEREAERKQKEKEEKREQKKLKKEKERLEKELKREKRKIAKKKEALKLQKQQMKEQEEQMKKQEQELQRLQKERQQEEQKQRRVDAERESRDQLLEKERYRNQRHDPERYERTTERKKVSRKDFSSPSTSQTPSKNSNTSSGYNSSSESEDSDRKNTRKNIDTHHLDKKVRRSVEQLEERTPPKSQPQHTTKLADFQQQQILNKGSRKSRFDLKDSNMDKEHLDSELERINQLEIENYEQQYKQYEKHTNNQQERTENEGQIQGDIEEGNFSDRWQLEKNEEDNFIEQINPFPYQVHSSDVGNKQRVLVSKVCSGVRGRMEDTSKEGREDYQNANNLEIDDAWDRIQDRKYERGEIQSSVEGKRKNEDQVYEANKRIRYQ